MEIAVLNVVISKRDAFRFLLRGDHHSKIAHCRWVLDGFGNAVGKRFARVFSPIFPDMEKRIFTRVNLGKNLIYLLIN